MIFSRILFHVVACAAVIAVHAQRPIIQTKFTADPAPLIYNDTIFLYTGHDEDDAKGFKMYDWLLYTSTDMVNWQEHGAVATLKDFKWCDKDNGAWAAQTVQRNGKFYMYCPVHGRGIGVLVADSPYGPFRDPLGKPLVWQKEHWDDIDPTVFIDDDGQAYMYWGNPNVYCVLLNDDMISLKSDVMKLCPKFDKYQEGPWMFKRNGIYYMGYSTTCCPEGLGYAMAKTPLGPWESKGYIMEPTPRSNGNHIGVIDYKGAWYAFGFCYDIHHILEKEHAERRSVSAFPLNFNPDGTIQLSPFFDEAPVKQIEPFNPFRRVEAEYMAWGFGLKTVKLPSGMIYVTNVNDSEHLLIKGVDFLNKSSIKFSVSAGTVGGGILEIRTDAENGTLLGKVNVRNTGGMENFKTFSTQIKGAQGIHDLYLVFRGTKDKELMNVDWWQFE